MIDIFSVKNKELYLQLIRKAELSFNFDIARRYAKLRENKFYTTVNREIRYFENNGFVWNSNYTKLINK